MARFINWRLMRGQWRRLVLGLGGIGIVAGSYCLGRNGALPEATAQAAPVTAQAPVAPEAPPPAPMTIEKYNEAVAYIYDSIPITRGELGEYLIARLPFRLDNLVNTRIIEHACQQRGIQVTAQEVEESFSMDLQRLKIVQDDFVKTVLKRYNKSLFEWKQDNIRPRLLMTKLCREKVTVDPKDLEKAFESVYGEKIDCQLIMWPLTEKNQVMTSIFAKIQKDEHDFEFAATHQASPTLAASGGHIGAASRHSSFGPELEKVVFSLRDGEISRVVETPEGLVVVKCLKHIPANTTVRITDPDVKKMLSDEIIDRKTQLLIPEVFKELTREAKPMYFLRTPDKEIAHRRDIDNDVKDAVNGTPSPGAGFGPKSN